MTDYEFSGNVGGVLSTFAMTMADDYDGVIRSAAGALRPGGRLAILEMKRPDGMPEWMIRCGAGVLRPFGVSPGYARRTPWVSVRPHLDEILYQEFYAGAIYLCVGEWRLWPRQVSPPSGTPVSTRVNSVQTDNPNSLLATPASRLC